MEQGCLHSAAITDCFEVVWSLIDFYFVTTGDAWTDLLVSCIQYVDLWIKKYNWNLIYSSRILLITTKKAPENHCTKVFWVLLLQPAFSIIVRLSIFLKY